MLAERASYGGDLTHEPARPSNQRVIPIRSRAGWQRRCGCITPGIIARLIRWLAAKPARTAAVTGALLIALGVFTFVYWDVRLPAMFGYGWFPKMPYR